MLFAVVLLPAKADLLSQRAAFKNQVLFKRVFDINPEVENWTNVFFRELFRKELSQLEIHFFEETDTSYGFIEGAFSGSFQDPPSRILNDESSFPDVEGDFVFYVDPSNGETSDYEFHFETEFEINDADSFFRFVRKGLFFCKKFDESLLSSFCRIFLIEDFNPNTNKVTEMTKKLSLWKDNLIKRLYEIEKSEVLATQSQFVNRITSHIVIEEFSDSVVLNLNLSDLKKEFEDFAKASLNFRWPISRSFESLRLEFFEDQILGSIHFKKLHSAKRVKLYAELSGLLQYFIEDEEWAFHLAQSLREVLREGAFSWRGLISHIQAKNLFRLDWTAESSFIREGEKTKEVPMDYDPEEDLVLY